MTTSDQIAKHLMTLIQLYEVPEEMTANFRELAHDQLVDAVNRFLFHHGPAIGIRSWGDCIQGLRDKGVDAVWNCHGDDTDIRLGIQIKSHGDFERTEGDSFRRYVFAQITESHQMNLSCLLLGLCADLTSKSQREKCNGLLADVKSMKDNYVIDVAPRKMAGIWKWSLGLQMEPLAQIEEAGYAWLTAIYDSLGNLNRNSWGKGSGGNWSHPRATVIRVGQQIHLSAVAISPRPGILECRFFGERSKRNLFRDWSPDPFWTWDVSDHDIGKGITIHVSVRRVKEYYQYNDADDYTYAIYDVLPKKQN
jgi:hypothetical protein